jgi:hypothetical protein
MSSRSSSLRIVVSGIAGLYPVGGVAWDYMQYPIGLTRLGHDVVYHEDTQQWPYDPVKVTAVDTASYTVEYLARFFQTYAPELSNRWHYRHLDAESFGLSQVEFARFAQSADLFLNISAANQYPTELGPRCVTAYLDTDPGFNQVALDHPPAWQTEAEWANSVEGFRRYDRFLTYAENIGEGDCLVPTLGVPWIKTRMPIVHSLWRKVPSAHEKAPWTTVMTWNAFPAPLVHNGREYGSKSIEFAKILSLPRATSRPLKIAIGGIAPLDSLAQQGWVVVDAPSVTLTPEAYRDFIAASRGEVSTAKNVYVAMKTGWFSCRTACYLAAGRPAVVQDTGFAKTIPVGKGLFAFDTLEQAVAAIETIEGDYRSHAAAARDVGIDQFDSDKVLTRMLNDIFAVSADRPSGT